MSSTPTEVAREGMEAWRRGDFETIERMLDPNVEWRWFEPGDWDCHNREDVMQVLRQRFEQGFAKGDVTFRRRRGRCDCRRASKRDWRPGLAG